MPMALSRSEKLLVHRDSEPRLLCYSVKKRNLQHGTARIFTNAQVQFYYYFGLTAFLQGNALLHTDCNASFISAAIYSVLPPKRQAIYFEVFSRL